MAIFEYQCTECGYIFEQININSSKVTNLSVECPNCKKLAKKIISSSNFIVRGYSYKNGYSKE